MKYSQIWEFSTIFMENEITERKGEFRVELNWREMCEEKL